MEDWFCFLCSAKVDVKNKKGGQIYDNQCTLWYLCPRCRKLWDEHTEDKKSGNIVFNSRADFNDYVKYIKSLIKHDVNHAKVEVVKRDNDD